MAHDQVARDHKADARAAFMGLIIGAIVLLGIIYSIVQLTNRKFDRHAPAAAASGAPSPAPGAPATQH